MPKLEDARKLLRAFAGEGLWFSRRTLIGQPPIALGKRVGVQLGDHVDGNKHTGFVIGVLFLELNGYRFTASEEAAVQAIIELAAGAIDESGFCEFLRANTQRSGR